MERPTGRRTSCSSSRRAPIPSRWELAQDVRTCFIHIDFEGLPEPERDALLAYPTTFALSEEQLLRLRTAARTLLAQSAAFQRLMRALREEPSVGAGTGGTRENCS